jgi:hypothetical protein
MFTQFPVNYIPTGIGGCKRWDGAMAQFVLRQLSAVVYILATTYSVCYLSNKSDLRVKGRRVLNKANHPQ